MTRRGSSNILQKHTTRTKLLLEVGTVLPLSQAVEAHRLLEGRKTTGKVVLQPRVNA
jgi:NADPH:quinone reductase-like Zn-dependent oxidoreductase